MEKRKPNDLSPDQCLAVDTESLCKLLDCGRHTAVQIGDLAHARIYDRILERCAPILFAGKNFREENAGATKQAAKDIVNRKSD